MFAVGRLEPRSKEPQESLLSLTDARDPKKVEAAEASFQKAKEAYEGAREAYKLVDARLEALLDSRASSDKASRPSREALETLWDLYRELKEEEAEGYPTVFEYTTEN